MKVLFTILLFLSYHFTFAQDARQQPLQKVLTQLEVYHTPALFDGGRKKAAPSVTTTGRRFAAFKPDNALAPHWVMTFMNN